MKRDIIREKILSTAESVFERHGYDKTILDDLGRAAGMNKTSLYYYYPNKEEIFAAVIHRQLDAYLVALEAKINKKKNGKNGVKSYLENRHSVLKKFNLLYKFRDVSSNVPVDIETKEIDFLKQLIAKGIKQGELRKSAEKGAKVILAAMNASSSNKDIEMLGEFLWEGIGKRKKDKAQEEPHPEF